MKTENTLETVTIARTGTLTLSRVIDFAKIAAGAQDGKVDASLLTEGGDFVVKLVTTGREPDTYEWPVEGYEAGKAFMAGFEACADARSRKAGGGSDFDAEAWLAENKRKDCTEDNLTKPQAMALAKHLEVEYKNAMKKGEIIALVAKKVPAK